MGDQSFFATFVRMLIILTPFFVLSMFLSVTANMPPHTRRILALKTATATAVICLLIYFFGEYVFRYLGITLDAFRIGAGLILMLTAVELVIGRNNDGVIRDEDEGDISIVPLSIPYTIGPGTIGVLMVMAAGASGNAAARIIESLGIVAAAAVLGALLYCSHLVERAIGRKGIRILSKVIGLLLAALSAQIIFTGIKNFLF